MPRSPLTKLERIKLFAAKYVEFGFNGSRVMLEVFKTPEGQENRRATEYLTDPEVQAEIGRVVGERIKSAEWTADDILRRIRLQYIKATKDDDRKNALMALKLYGEQLGMFKKHMVHDVSQKLEDLIAGSMVKDGRDV